MKKNNFTKNQCNINSSISHYLSYFSLSRVVNQILHIYPIFLCEKVKLVYCEQGCVKINFFSVLENYLLHSTTVQNRKKIKYRMLHIEITSDEKRMLWKLIIHFHIIPSHVVHIILCIMYRCTSLSILAYIYVHIVYISIDDT